MRTLGENIGDWLLTYKQSSVKATSYDRLRTSYKMLQTHKISQIVLAQLRKDNIQSYVNDLTAQGYSRSTIKKQFFLVRAYLQYAVSEGLFRAPIYVGIRLPAKSIVKKKPREVVSYTPEEQQRLCAVLQEGNNPCWLAALFMMWTGLRAGECLALQWDDVLWDKTALRVNKTVIHDTEHGAWIVQDGAKSYTSNRTIPLGKDAINLLERMKFHDQSNDGFIFHDKSHKGLSYDSVRWHVYKACKNASVAYSGLHIFRHTFATNCYRRGCDVKILSKLLGHADTSVTFNIYIHLFGDGLEEMRAVVE